MITQLDMQLPCVFEKKNVFSEKEESSYHALTGGASHKYQRALTLQQW
jgi:hypothetical protein